MNELWLKLLGVPPERIPEGATTAFDFANMPDSWRLFLMIGLIALGVWGIFYLYRRESKTCPLGVRLLLGGIRTLVLALLVLIGLEPILTPTQRHRFECAVHRRDSTGLNR